MSNNHNEIERATNPNKRLNSNKRLNPNKRLNLNKSLNEQPTKAKKGQFLRTALFVY
ncbi:MAG: hypothetical protein U0103_20580 [Candidatus Obscuribacterales bacterium]